MFSILIFIFRFLPFLYLLGVIAVFVHNVKTNIKKVVVNKMEQKLNASFQMEIPTNALVRLILVTLFGGRKGAVLLILGVLAWFVSI